MARYNDTFRMNPITLFGVIGATVAFIAVGAITDVLWVAIGAVVGAGVGLVLRHFAKDAAAFRAAVDLSEGSTRSDLYEQAQELDIEGRSSMNRDELAAAVA